MAELPTPAPSDVQSDLKQLELLGVLSIKRVDLGERYSQLFPSTESRCILTIRCLRNVILTVLPWAL